MVKFCHIAPVDFMDELLTDQTHHLALAHLVEESEEYVRWYKKFPIRQLHQNVVILDNSAFEMYKRGLPMYPSEQLIEMGHRIQADYIVMSDYPAQPSWITINSAIELAPIFKREGFRTFFCPQSEVGDLDDLLNCFEWAATSPLVDYIGVSILAIPNAYGVEKNNKLQRFVSRYMFMQLLKDRGTLERIKRNGKKMHLLGMVDGPNEIKLMHPFKGYIDTWDSSAAIWAGLNDIAFDESPTGLISGKFEKEVDFDVKINDYTQSLIFCAKKNMEYINSLCVRYL